MKLTGFIAFHVWLVPPDRRPVDTYMQILSVVILCPYVESCLERKKHIFQYKDHLNRQKEL